MFLACAFSALALISWGLYQLDLPVTRFMRSVHDPTIERVGDVLARLGSGVVLTALGFLMFAAGWLAHRPRLTEVGWQSLLAHGLAAAVTNLLKHLVGRPRPRMTHGGTFEIGPSWASGLDSFPSGHASASFAVATIVAAHVPALAWPAYTLAGCVAVSRIVRGSHFPTDVMAGTLVGCLAGAVIARVALWRGNWREVLRWDAVGEGMTRGFARGLLFVSGGFALLWTLAHAGTTIETAAWLVVGLAMIGTGLALRWRLTSLVGQATSGWSGALLGAGVMATSGLWVVAAVGLLTGMAYRVATEDELPGSVSMNDGSNVEQTPRIEGEVALTAGLLLAVALLQTLRGIAPLV